MNVWEKSFNGYYLFVIRTVKNVAISFLDDCAICFLNWEINTGRGVGWWITWACSNGLAFNSSLSYAFIFIKHYREFLDCEYSTNPSLTSNKSMAWILKISYPYEVPSANPLLTFLVPLIWLFEAVLLNTSTGDPHCSLFSVVNIVKLQLLQSSAGCVLIKTREREHPSHWL